MWINLYSDIYPLPQRNPVRSDNAARDTVNEYIRSTKRSLLWRSGEAKLLFYHLSFCCIISVIFFLIRVNIFLRKIYNFLYLK